VPGGNTLVLGATRELCTMARDVSGTVTAVDFSEPIIETLRVDGVRYIRQEWFDFLEVHPEQYENIMTDGGLLCLDFPGSWQRMADQIYAHLTPGGIFSARIYVSTPNQPKDHYENPNLGRFVSSMALATEGTNWMLHPKHGDYADYDVQYAFPPEAEVLRTLGRFALIGKRVPDYEEGDRFVSYAFQRSQ
jgi:hypothetical protein